MTLDLQTFTRLDLHGRIAASRLEADLADAIRAPLEQAVHHAHARLVAVTAAGEWHVPDQDEVVNLSQLVALLTAAVEPVRRRILDSILIPTMEAAGINFTVRNDLAEGVLAQLGQRISMLAEGEREQIMNRLDAAWTGGESIAQAAEGLLGLNQDGITLRRATMIARTELAATTNGASLAAARITGAAPYKVWLTAPGAPHPRHELIEGLDGQTVPIDGLFDVDGAMLDHPGDPNGPPEAVIQCRCLPGWQRVSGGRIRAAMQRPFEGDLVQLVTASGRELTATANHPVLTPRGWVAAGCLVEGDHVVCRSSADLGSAAHPDVDDAESSIEQIYRSLMLAAAGSQRATGVAGYLYGEMVDGEIDVAMTDDHLTLGWESALSQEVSQLAFAASHREMSLARPDASLVGIKEPDLVGVAASPSGDSCFSQDRVDGGSLDAELLMDGEYARSIPVCLRDGVADGGVASASPVADTVFRASADAVCADMLPDRHHGDALLLGDLLVAHSGLVELDPVVHREVCLFAGHVYDLSMEDGAFAADGIILANCTIAYTDSMTASHRPADRRGRLMPVPRPLTAAATPFTDLPLSAQDAPWDAAAAEAAMTTPDQLKQGHFWMDTSDGADPAAKASYKLPFVADGKAVWAGCTAAAGACMGARGGVSIPDADMPGVKAHIAKYFAKAAQEFSDDTITPPWMAQTAARLRARQAGITASLSLVAAAGDAGGMPTCGSWRMETATLLDTMTPDGRTLASAGMTMRDMPLPLMAMFDDSHDPNGMSPLPPTVCVGRIETASADGDRLVESGVFYDTPDGQRAMMEAADGVLRPSIDGFPMAWTLSFAPWDEAANGPEFEEGPDGEVTAVHFRADEQQILFSEWELVSTTLVRVPAMPTASIDVLMDGEMGAPSAVAASVLSAFSVREKPRPAAVEESLPAALASVENGSQPVLLALDALAANMRATSGLSAIEALAASLRRNSGERAPGDVDLVELVRAVGEASRDPAMSEMAQAVAAAAGRPLPEPAPITVHSSPVTLNPSDVHVDVQPPHVEVTAGGKPRALRAERDPDGNVTRYVEEEVVNG